MQGNSLIYIYILEPVLGLGFVGSRSRGFAVKIFFFEDFFLKILSDFFEVIFQFLVQFVPTFFLNP